MLSFLYGPTLTSIHDYWKNHNLTFSLKTYQKYAFFSPIIVLLRQLFRPTYLSATSLPTLYHFITWQCPPVLLHVHSRTHCNSLLFPVASPRLSAVTRVFSDEVSPLSSPIRYVFLGLTSQDMSWPGNVKADYSVNELIGTNQTTLLQMLQVYLFSHLVTCIYWLTSVYLDAMENRKN